MTTIAITALIIIALYMGFKAEGFDKEEWKKRQMEDDFIN